MIADYPRPDPVRMEDAEADRFDTLIEMVQAIRSLRVELSVPEGTDVEVFFDAEPGVAAWLGERATWMKRLARVKRFASRHEATDWPEKSPAVLVRGIEIRLPIVGLVNVEELTARLEKEEQKLDGDLTRLRARLDNPGFVAKAPPEVVEKDRALAEELQARLDRVRENLRLVRG